MHLAIFGLSISSSWGNGHATLWRGLCAALARQGHTVTFFEKDVTYYAAHRDYFELPNGRLLLYPDWESVRARAKEVLSQADVGMVTSYCADGLAASELVCDSNVPVRAFYDLDAPVTLDRLRAGTPVDYIGPEGLRGFDLVLSYTGGPTLDELKRRLGAKHAVPLYGSVDPEVHRPSRALPHYRADLSYLGTYSEDRQSALEDMFIHPARRRPQNRFVIAGAQYPESFPWSSNIYFVRHLPPDEHPSFYSSSRLTLNVTRRAMAVAGFCPSGRLFEAAACGVPVLTDWWPGLDQFFEPGREVFVGSSANDTEELLHLDNAELHRVAAAARERTLDCHTADRRAAELIGYLEHPETNSGGISCGVSYQQQV